MEAEPDGVTVTVATDDDVPDAGGVDAGGAGVPGADGEEGAVTVVSPSRSTTRPSR